MSISAESCDCLCITSFGATGDGIVDDTSTIQDAFDAAASTDVTLDGGGLTYRTTGKLDVSSGLKLRNATFLIDHAGTGIGKSSGTIARCAFTNVRLRAAQTAAIGWDCNQFQYCLFTDCFVGTGGGGAVFTIGRKYSNTAYWNVEIASEMEAFITAWDLADANDSRFYGCRHVYFTGANSVATVNFSSACSGVQFYGLSCETVYTSANVIRFDSGCEANLFAGFRIESRSGSTSVLPIKFNGSAGNSIVGGYILGAGIGSITDAIGNNEVSLYANSATLRHMGSGLIDVPKTSVTLDTNAQFTFNPTTQTFKGYAGGARTFAMTPAAEHQLMNGYAVAQTAAVTPGMDNSYALGAGALRYSVVYAATGTINTSDLRDKDWRGTLSNSEKRAAHAITQSIGAYRYLSAIEEKQNKARLHVGTGAQIVRDALRAEGLDSEGYALLCHDAWPVTDATSDAAGVPAGDRWGLRLDQLALFLIAGLNDRLEQVERRVGV